jgi:hypothetical protein
MLLLELILCCFCFAVCQSLLCGRSSPVCLIVFHLVLAVRVCRRRLSLIGGRAVYTKAHKNDRLETKRSTTSGSDRKYPWNAGLFLFRLSNSVTVSFTQNCRATITRPSRMGFSG